MLSSAEIVESTDDLLLQILLLLPVKSLMRFKSVSKHWKHLITTPQFSQLRNPSPNPAVGLFYPRLKVSEYLYVAFDHRKIPTTRKLNFPDDPFAFWIQQSCNGLLLCCSSGYSVSRHSYPSSIRVCYIYNPTTNWFTKLPRPGVSDGVPRIVHGVNLAFSHDKSPPYKCVCVRGSAFARELFQVEIYSPECGAWRVSGEPFESAADFDYGVYWNGSVHWINYLSRELLYFNVGQEKLRNASLPHERRNYGQGPRKVVFGESCDHLHMIERFNTEMTYRVHEMKSDYSQWFVKYKVNLSAVASAFPQMTFMNVVMSRVLVLSLVRDEGKGPFLVFSVGSKCIRFNLEHNTFEEICDIGNDVAGYWLPFAFEHVESLACV